MTCFLVAPGRLLCFLLLGQEVAEVLLKGRKLRIIRTEAKLLCQKAAILGRPLCLFLGQPFIRWRTLHLVILLVELECQFESLPGSRNGVGASITQ